MKKLFFVTAIFLAIATTSFPQVFEKGSQAINLGIGFGNTAYFGGGYSFFPSISASYEYAIVEVPMGSDLTGVVSVGGYFGWAGSKYAYDYWDDLSYHYNAVYFAARGNFHFIFHDKLDPYAGVWLGGKVLTGTWTGSGEHPDDWNAASGGFAGGVYVGCRYFFSDQWAVYSELGYLISVFNVGVTYKIK
jgi:hypothetical protein